MKLVIVVAIASLSVALAQTPAPTPTSTPKPSPLRLLLNQGLNERPAQPMETVEVYTHRGTDGVCCTTTSFGGLCCDCSKVLRYDAARKSWLCIPATPKEPQ